MLSGFQPLEGPGWGGAAAAPAAAEADPKAAAVSLLRAASNAGEASIGLRGDLGGTGGGTLFLDPGWRSHKTAGRFKWGAAAAAASA